MELNDKQIKDLVARRHPEYEKNIGTSSPALPLAGVVGLQTISFVTLKREIRSLRSVLSVPIASTTLVRW